MKNIATALTKLETHAKTIENLASMGDLDALHRVRQSCYKWSADIRELTDLVKSQYDG